MILVEILIHEMEHNSNMTPYTLDSPYNHPSRLRICNAYVESISDTIKVRVVGGQGLFKFTSDTMHNPDFAGVTGIKSPAWILGRIDDSRSMESDRFLEASHLEKMLSKIDPSSIQRDLIDAF